MTRKSPESTLKRVNSTQTARAAQKPTLHYHTTAPSNRSQFGKYSAHQKREYTDPKGDKGHVRGCPPSLDLRQNPRCRARNCGRTRRQIQTPRRFVEKKNFWTPHECSSN